MATDKNARILWDFLKVGDTLEKADVIEVLGSFDLRIPEWGSKIILKDLADFMVMAGYKGRPTPADWTDGEAVKFAETARLNGVSPDKILVEDKSVNTRENLLFSHQLLLQKGITPKKVIIISQPFMQKRIQALVTKMQEDKDLGNFELILPFSNFTYDNYPNDVVDKEEMINILVGEVQRLQDYPKKDFIYHQNIPAEILEAAEKLSKLGFTKYLVSKTIFP